MGSVLALEHWTSSYTPAGVLEEAWEFVQPSICALWNWGRRSAVYLEAFSVFVEEGLL